MRGALAVVGFVLLTAGIVMMITEPLDALLYGLIAAIIGVALLVTGFVLPGCGREHRRRHRRK